MDNNEFTVALDLLKKANVDPQADCLTFITKGGMYRGRIKARTPSAIDNLVFLIEIIDVHDTSGAGNDLVAVPLSQIISVYHDAMKHRLERNKGK